MSLTLTVFTHTLTPGFTSIAERIPAQQLIETLAEYFNAMTDEIVLRNGLVGDFIGDAVFAFWNTPEKVARHGEARLRVYVSLCMCARVCGLTKVMAAFMACDAAMAQQVLWL